MAEVPEMGPHSNNSSDCSEGSFITALASYEDIVDESLYTALEHETNGDSTRDVV